MNEHTMPGKASFEQQIISKVMAEDNRWLTDHLCSCLSTFVASGLPVTEQDLPQYLPRLTLRQYPDGTMIMAIDAKEGKIGQPLFGFGEGSLQPTPAGEWKWLRPVLTSVQALSYELRRRHITSLEPEAEQQPEPEAPWPKFRVQRPAFEWPENLFL